jgi:membrane peptidoglycan carboxypeptidase
VRPGSGRARRDPAPQDPFEAEEPATGVARVGEPRPGLGGRHAARSLLPSGLSIQRALRVRGRLLSATFATLLVLLGTGVVGTSYFLDSVELSTDLTFPSTTTVYYSDGTTELARLGEVTRYELPYDRISEVVTDAIVASEDETFWTNAGIDVGGVARAAWNNFTGGRTQGASTITQQYARLAYELGGVNYQRKLKEAVLAWKMNQTMEKWEILEAYLNAVPFGRQAYGIEAAVKAFYGPNKTADRTAPPENQITLAEAMALVAMVKQPYPDPADPVGAPGYDPTVSEEAAVWARNRFEYVRGQLQRMGEIPAEQAAALQFPETIVPYEPVSNGLDGPAGHIVQQVLSELTHTPTSPFNGAKDWTNIKEGGYQIYTTIDKGVQDAAIKAAGRLVEGSTMTKQPETLQGALVAVQPGTGRVLAYYGGDKGQGSDFAGTYLDENDDVLGWGYHPPGSSFKVYTLAAALRAGYSLRSYWEWQPVDLPGAAGGNRIRNSARCGELEAEDPTPCSLLQSTISSVNVPFYRVTLSVGAANVLATARDAGIEAMYTNDRERVDLTALEDLNTSGFDARVGIGQYPITVLQHATGMATMAFAGLHAETHFVTKVTKQGQLLYGETLPAPDQERILEPTQVNDLTYALSQVNAAKTNIGWETAGKTGTWEWGGDSSENAHAWMVGFSRSIAAAVWIGNSSSEGPLRDANHNKISGPGLPAQIWRAFMADATKAMNLPRQNTRFNPPNYLGETEPPGAVPSPTPTGKDDWPDGWPTLPGWPPTRDVEEQ